MDDKNSFAMIDLGCKITKEYEVKQLPQSPLFYPPGQFPIINLENQQSLKEAFNIFETNTAKLDKWSQDTWRLVASAIKLLFLYFNEQMPIANIARDNLLEFRNLIYKVATKLAQIFKTGKRTTNFPRLPFKNT
ncbi:MAG: hypothetical protein ACTTJC_07165 [Campylobacter sp.]